MYEYIQHPSDLKYIPALGLPTHSFKAKSIFLNKSSIPMGYFKIEGIALHLTSHSIDVAIILLHIKIRFIPQMTF